MVMSAQRAKRALRAVRNKARVHCPQYVTKFKAREARCCFFQQAEISEKCGDFGRFSEISAGDFGPGRNLRPKSPQAENPVNQHNNPPKTKNKAKLHIKNQRYYIFVQRNNLKNLCCVVVYNSAVR